MKKVNYFNEIGNSEAMGMDPLSIGPIEGEFLGVIKEDNKDYLITRTTLAFNNDPEYIGKITARHVIAEYVPDHMSFIYIDMEEDENSRNIETILNKEENKHITEEELAIKFKNVITRKYNEVINESLMDIPNKDSEEKDYEFTVVAIEHSIFKDKQENIQKLENGDSYNSGRSY